MKKFAAGILTALCATAIATAQPIDQPTDYAQQPVSTQAAPAEAVAPQAVATEAQANETMPIDEQQQTYSVQKKAPIGFGARVAFIYGNFWGFEDLSDGLEEPTGFGGEFGVATRFNIVKGLQFAPEILFRFFNLSHDDDDVERCYNQMFLDLSLYIRGIIGGGFFLEVGPQLSINTSSDYSIDGVDNEFEKITQSTAEFGLNFGLGYYVLENLSVSFRWYMGFTEVFPDVKYYFDDNFKPGKDQNGSWSTINLKGAHTMMFKFGATYWFI
jgi:hypothetical protein